MSNLKEKRNDYRFRTDFSMDSNTSEDIFSLEIDVQGPVRGQVLDISLKGACVEFSGLDDSTINNINMSQDIFLKLFWGDDFIVVGGRNIWHTFFSRDGVNKYRCGMEFQIMSPEDTLRLADSIENLRSGGCLE